MNAAVREGSIEFFTFVGDCSVLSDECVDFSDDVFIAREG